MNSDYPLHPEKLSLSFSLCRKELIYLKSVPETFSNRKVNAKLLVGNQSAPSLIKNGIKYTNEASTQTFVSVLLVKGTMMTQ